LVFHERLIAMPSVWDGASLRTMRPPKKLQFGVHLAADYRLAGSCLTIFAARKAHA
jgi:hypothetical protein